MRLITVAIHTANRAVQLKNLLEQEGIHVTLQNVNLENPEVSAGVRVRINEDDLPLALRIIENTDIFTPQGTGIPEADHPVIVPVDFSHVSLNACKAAFQLAAHHGRDIVLIHSFIDPYTTGNMQLSDALTFDLVANDKEALRQVEQTASEQMNHFASKLRDMIKNGELPAVKFTSKILEGVPEDAIADFAKLNPPYLTVMGTRRASRKANEMIGSVTAEVIDKCLFSVLTIPESDNAIDREGFNPHNILFFGNLDQEDILAMDTMARIFPRGDATVTIVHVPGKRRPFGRSTTGSMQHLVDYCNKNFNGFRFRFEDLSLEKSFENFEEIAHRQQTDLVVVPNKRRSVFSRLINRGLPSRILFNSDVAMLVIRI